MIEDYNELYDEYMDSLETYQEGLLSYQENYIDVMVELWDDFIGVPRAEGQEMAKTALSKKLPEAPEVPLIDVLYENPTPEDFECLGNKCKSVLPFVEDNQKSFGVYGVDGEAGYDFNYESVRYYIMKKDINEDDFLMTPKLMGAEEALMYAENVCRPKVMYVTISIKDKDYVPGSNDATELSFGLTYPNSDIRDIILDVIADGYASDKKADMAPLPGASDIAKFGTTYASDSATAIYGSVAVSAALVAMTLY